MSHTEGNAIQSSIHVGHRFLLARINIFVEFEIDWMKDFDFWLQFDDHNRK